jgi:hypothetical protein
MNVGGKISPVKFSLSVVFINVHSGISTSAICPSISLVD